MTFKIRYELVLSVVLAFGQVSFALDASDGNYSPNPSKNAAEKRLAHRRHQNKRRKHRRPAGEQSPPAQPAANPTRTRPVLDGQPMEEAPETRDYRVGDPRANQAREYKPPVRRDRPKRDNP